MHFPPAFVEFPDRANTPIALTGLLVYGVLSQRVSKGQFHVG
jgi:hypothetical protein